MGWLMKNPALYFQKQNGGQYRRLSGKECACQWRRYKRCGFNTWVRAIPWRRKWQPSPVLLSGKFHGQRSLANGSSCGHKEWDTTERAHTHTHTQTHTHTPLWYQVDVSQASSFWAITIRTKEQIVNSWRTRYRLYLPLQHPCSLFRKIAVDWFNEC